MERNITENLLHLLRLNNSDTCVNALTFSPIGSSFRLSNILNSIWSSILVAFFLFKCREIIRCSGNSLKAPIALEVILAQMIILVGSVVDLIAHIPTLNKVFWISYRLIAVFVEMNVLSNHMGIFNRLFASHPRRVMVFAILVVLCHFLLHILLEFDFLPFFINGSVVHLFAFGNVAVAIVSSSFFSVMYLASLCLLAYRRLNSSGRFRCPFGFRPTVFYVTCLLCIYLVALFGAFAYLNGNVKGLCAIGFVSFASGILFTPLVYWLVLRPIIRRHRLAFPCRQSELYRQSLDASGHLSVNSGDIVTSFPESCVHTQAIETTPTTEQYHSKSVHMDAVIKEYSLQNATTTENGATSSAAMVAEELEDDALLGRINASHHEIETLLRVDDDEDFFSGQMDPVKFKLINAARPF